MKLIRFSKTKNQGGLASIVVTLVLVALLSTIGVAFAVLMNRELNKSLANQLSQVAYDAAESGINDVISYVRDNPNANVTDCQGLLRAGAPLSQAYQLSPSTKYTCVLLNTQPTSLAYQSILADHSQVIKVTTSSPASKAMVSWQATNRTYNKFIGSQGSACNSVGTLYDESKWNGCNTAPMMRVSIYPVPADTLSLDNTAANSRTYFLYPANSTSSTVDQVSYNTQTGSLVPVDCGVQATNGTFPGSADYDCNLIITNLPAGGSASGNIYYIRFTPIYSSADVLLKSSTATGQSVKFLYTQAVVDVTAQASQAVKRLQARVDISSLNGTSQDITSTSNGFPEYALQSAGTICKRIQVSTHADYPAYIDDNSRPYCGSGVTSLAPLSPPVPTITDCHSTDYTTASCSGTVNPNNGTVSACSWSLSDGQSTGCPGTGGNSTTPYGVGWDIGNLNSGSSYTATLCATNQAGQRCTSASFSTPEPPPPPPPSGGGDPYLTSFTQPTDTDCNVRYGFTHSNNCFDYAGGNLGDCSVSYDGSGLIDIGDHGSTGGSFTLGNGPANPANTYIQCGSAQCYLGATCAQPPPPASSISVSVRPVWYHFSDHRNYDNYVASGGTCRDGFHDYIMCTNWTANENGNSNFLGECNVHTDKGYVSGNQAVSGSWDNQGFTLGYGPIDPSQVNIWVTCSANDGATGTSSVVGCSDFPPNPDTNGNRCHH